MLCALTARRTAHRLHEPGHVLPCIFITCKVYSIIMCVVHATRIYVTSVSWCVSLYGGAAHANTRRISFSVVNLCILHKTAKKHPVVFTYFNLSRGLSCGVQQLQHMCSAADASACSVCPTPRACLPCAAAKPFSAPKNGNSEQKTHVAFDLNQFNRFLCKNVTARLAR